MRLFTILVLVYGVSFSWGKTRVDEDALRKKLTELEDQIRDLKKDITRANDDIAGNDSLIKIEAGRFDQLKLRHENDLERRRGEIKSLGGRRDSLKRQIRIAKGQESNFLAKVKNSEAREKFLQEKIANECRRLEEVVAKSLPWEKETRVERIRALRRELEAGSVSVVEGFTRYNAIVQEEIRFGDEVVLANKSMKRNDGELVNAQLLRIGNQFMVYVDDEDKRYGILDRETKGDSIVYKWREELNFDERKMVRDAVDVKAAKQAPKVVVLPLKVKGGEK